MDITITETSSGRHVFVVDTGDMPEEKVKLAIEKIKNEFSSRRTNDEKDNRN